MHPGARPLRSPIRPNHLHPRRPDQVTRSSRPKAPWPKHHRRHEASGDVDPAPPPSSRLTDDGWARRLRATVRRPTTGWWSSSVGGTVDDDPARAWFPSPIVTSRRSARWIRASPRGPSGGGSGHTLGRPGRSHGRDGFLSTRPPAARRGCGARRPTSPRMREAAWRFGVPVGSFRRSSKFADLLVLLGALRLRVLAASRRGGRRGAVARDRDGQAAGDVAARMAEASSCTAASGNLGVRRAPHVRGWSGRDPLRHGLFIPGRWPSSSVSDRVPTVSGSTQAARLSRTRRPTTRSAAASRRVGWMSYSR